MDEIVIKPTNITAITQYLLNLEHYAVNEHYQPHWPQGKQCLKEVLDGYINPGRIVGETLIDHFDRSLNHLFQSTRLLARQLTSKTKQQLETHLQYFDQQKLNQQNKKMLTRA
jgi:hypothetical protein